MRLFVAIALPGPVTGALEEAVAPLRPAWPELRWTGRDAWHLTLSFLGEVDDRVAVKLERRLANAAARHPQLRLSLDGAGAFPSTARAQVLWAGVTGDRRGLARLAATVSAAARRAGVAPSDGRHYQPHVTLARCREPADARPLLADLAGYAGQEWTAREIYLIHSRLGSEPRYVTLGSWPLRAPEPAGYSRSAT